ncbi:MAG: metallophosphoesterase [Bacteroidales bacterium]|jgi:predicted MPP superfamily phosphohydrolase|nr:metallophosphoesterase [Bacteroidales bacterium]
MSFFLTAFVLIILDTITVRGIKYIFPNFWIRHKSGIKTFFILQVIFFLFFLMGGFFLQEHTRDYRVFTVYYYLFGLMVALYSPKTIFAISLVLDIIISRTGNKKRRSRNLSPKNPSHILAKCGMVTGVCMTLIIVWGILFGRYNYDVHHVQITFDDLPVKFDGFKIAQISDVHAGSSAGMIHRFQKAVDLINQQAPDIIVFTGDMVNNFAEETYPLIPVFSGLKASGGKYAVMGNHDYGMYYKWKTPAEEKANIQNTEQAITSMGFDLLNNRSVVIEKDSLNRIAVVGIENWGIRDRHPKLGDIDIATDSVKDIPFKILLSHDPSFWAEKIKGKTDIPLTLSGHTHGMQIGARFGKRRFSPARMQYEYWAGLYQVNRQYLYVNRGLGVIAFPGRIGMPPEITILELKRKD